MPQITIETILGPILIEWQGKTLSLIKLGEKAKENNRAGFPFPEIIDYFKGVVNFSHYQLNLSGYSSFTRLVLEKCQEIPYGELISYRELAGRVGSPQASRAVGTALGKNCYPIIIPCHRVIGSNNELRGFSAGLEWKKFLIDWEKKHKNG